VRFANRFVKPRLPTAGAAVILDVLMPGIDGLEVCRVRRPLASAPIASSPLSASATS
jgi:CheY-like chemotaxis protein